ncbi:MAG: PQQ-dependent sugar dehydrogenase [Caulobacteraceae bacterium]
MRKRLAATLLAAAGLTGLLLTATAACSQAAAPDKAAKAPAAVVFGDWRADAPGVRHRITVADLPAPFATKPSVGMAQVATPPAGALPKVPAGFSVALYAKGLESPRAMSVAPNGDVFVAEQTAGRIRVLRPGGAAPSANAVFATGLDQPFGVAFYPVGPNPQWVYVANNNAVVRFPYRNGDLQASGPPEVIVPQLSPHTGGHWTRDIVFTPDGKRMLISVGSAGNLDEGMDKLPLAQAQAFDAEHGLGAAWGADENRADILAADPEGKGLHVFAAGIRNCSGLTLQPATGLPWCSVNERDMIGDNLVPDYVTHVQEGAFYGWPWYYIGSHEDPRLKGERPDLAGKVTVPDVLIQPHSAAVEVEFYQSGAAGAFPAPYQGAAFVALHGSWNRAQRTGYKVVMLPMKDGKASGDYVDFLTGFVVDDQHVWGRPYGIAVLQDGSLLVGEDANGQIFRVTYGK